MYIFCYHFGLDKKNIVNVNTQTSKILITLKLYFSVEKEQFFFFFISSENNILLFYYLNSSTIPIYFKRNITYYNIYAFSIN